MSNRVSPFGSFKSIRQLEITGDVATRASVHETNRQNEIKKILVHAFLMAKFDVIKKGDAVGQKKAEAQHISGTGGTQAAHCLPCQILVKNNALQSLLATVSDDLFIEVATAFSTTDILPTNFNKADSLVEGNQLKKRLETPALKPSTPDTIYTSKTRAASCRTLKQSSAATRDAPAPLQTSIAHLQTTILAATGAKREEREERAEIIRCYQRTLETASASLETVLFLHVEDLHRMYRELTNKS